ncbi:MAG TPA: peptidoglycan editing factor PgeF [Burkholderiales bacterium]|nr:peptidoglycan editing factor PgeF [Burkholderiales bacterium]
MSAAFHPDWIVPDWPAPAGVRALVTTRSGGVSAGPYATLNLGSRVGDEPACVERNRAVLRACLPSEPRWMKQVHGTRVAGADAAAHDVEADAAVATRAGEVCAVLVADCMPVLLCDDAASVVAVAHAGWRGLSAGVVEAAVAAMRVPARRVLAWLGPAIGPRAYEVGGDVREAFAGGDAGAADAFAPLGGGKFLADLAALARRRLSSCGVGRVYGGGFCTASDPRFFSFRRDRITGRMAGLIWMER